MNLLAYAFAAITLAAPAASNVAPPRVADIRTWLENGDPIRAAEAIEAWSNGPPPRALVFDIAVELTEQDAEPERAEALFHSLAVEPEAGLLARDAAANIGRLRFVSTLVTTDATSEPAATGPEDPAAALRSRAAKLVSAERAYRAALDFDPNDTEAAESLEVVRHQLADVLDSLRALREAEQQRQQAQQELANQLQDLAERQSEAANNDAADSERRDEQEQLNEQTEAAQQNAEQQANPETSEAIQQAREAQQRADDAMQRGEQEAAREAQAEAAEALQRASEAARAAAQPSDAESEQGGEPGESEPAEGEQQSAESDTEAEGDALAESLLEQEKDRREERAAQRARMRTGGTSAVEKDW
ncbi:MAG: hypothetical protein AAF138_11370 [Planctomycetota bacterium]